MSHQATLSQPDFPCQPPSRLFWPAWMARLRSMGLDQVAAAALDGAGPLGLILAQVVYLGQPLLGGQSSALARLLEDQNEAQAFAAFLREEDER